MTRRRFGVTLVVAAALGTVLAASSPLEADLFARVAGFSPDGTAGFVAWRDSSAERSVVRYYETDELVAEWTVDGFAVKSISALGAPGSRRAFVLGNRAEEEGDAHGQWIGRIYDFTRSQPTLVWSSETLEGDLSSPDLLSVSEDGELWLVGLQRAGGVVELSVGTIGEAAPFREVSEVPSGTQGQGELSQAGFSRSQAPNDTLYFEWEGRAFIAQAGAERFSALPLPNGCGQVMSISSAEGRVWLDCVGEFPRLAQEDRRDALLAMQLFQKVARLVVVYDLSFVGDPLVPVSASRTDLEVPRTADMVVLASGEAMFFDRATGSALIAGLDPLRSAIEVTEVEQVPPSSDWAGGAFVSGDESEVVVSLVKPRRP